MSRACQIPVSSRPTGNGDAYVLDGVVAIALAVPYRAAGLGVAGLVRGAGAHRRLTWPTEMGEQFPPQPAVLSAVTDQAASCQGCGDLDRGSGDTAQILKYAPA